MEDGLRTAEPDRPARSVVQSFVADIRTPARLRTVFQQTRPEVVFHAAAHKHVPLMEANPTEAITNNVFGTRNVVEAAQAVGVERFVMLSTDKAVNPTSVMGASKRAAELVVHAAAQATAGPMWRYASAMCWAAAAASADLPPADRGGRPDHDHAPGDRALLHDDPGSSTTGLQAAVAGPGGEVFVLTWASP